MPLRPRAWLIAGTATGVLAVFTVLPGAVAWAQEPAVAAPAATVFAGGTGYAAQVAGALDKYVDRVVVALQAAGREGAQSFDTRKPAIIGPNGSHLPLEFTERQSDRLVHHPASLAILTPEDIASAMQGQRALLRDDRLIVAAVNPGGASAIGVAIPLAEVSLRLPDGQTVGGILLFDEAGHLIAARAQLPAEQRAVFEEFLPNQPPGLVVTGAPYSIARMSRANLVVATRLASGSGAPEPKLDGLLLANPDLVVLPKPQGQGMADLASRGAILAVLCVVLFGGLGVLWGRRRRNLEARLNALAEDRPVKPPPPWASPKQALPELKSVDYLHELAEGPKGRRGEEVGPEPLDEAIGHERIDPAIIEETEALEALESLYESPQEGPVSLDAAVHEEAIHEAQSVAEVIADSELADPGDALTHVAESESAAPTPEEVPLKRIEIGPPPEFRERRRVDLPRTPEVHPDRPPSREVTRYGRSAIPSAPDETQDTLRRGKTVNPSDVLVTRGEVQPLVEKEGDRLFARMQALVRDVEKRNADALADHRETFRHLLEQFEVLQEDRERDLTTLHDFKNEVANEVANATLKLKHAESKATEGLVRLKEQVDNLTRRVEGWSVDSRLAEERLAGGLEGMREGFESQLQAHEELRKEAMKLADGLQDMGRRHDTANDREVAGRRGAIDQLAFEIKTVQLAAENDFSVMAGRLDELKAATNTLEQKAQRAESQQIQAFDAINRKIEAGEALEALKRHLMRAIDDLDARQVRDETRLDDVGAVLEKLQTDLREEHGMLLNQLYHEIDKTVTAAAKGTVEYKDQFEALREESSRLAQRQHQMVQLIANLHNALSKSDARATEEVERLKAQNNEMHTMIVNLLRGARQPGPPPGQQPQRRPGPPPDAQQAPSQPQPAPQPAPQPEPKPIDLWSRLLGREKDQPEESAQRKRRPRP